VQSYGEASPSLAITNASEGGRVAATNDPTD
jgi:hypothetical protein